MLTALLLDLMGTVVHDPYVEALEAATGLPLNQARRIKDPDSWPEFECGAIDEDEFVRRFFRDPDQGHAFDVAAFHKVRRDGYRFLPGMAELLAELDGRVERYVASNYPVWIDELHTAFGFDDLFEGVYVSCRLGVRKPDPAFFEALLAGIGQPPQACLFVDDRKVNCDAAAALGIPAHQFDGAEGLRARLRDERVLP